MKFLLAFVALSGFITIAVFGFATMNHEGSHGHSGCIASMAQRTDCFSQTGILEMVTMHANVFNTLSSAVLSQSFILLFLLSLLLVLIINSPGLSLRVPPSRFKPVRYGYGLFKPILKQKYIYWLALHENSPAIP